ncbi:MAG: hypothetical protein ABSB15_29735 [Bryobacteraceae bacterium]|jgi:hypothetical protein
MDTSVAKDMIGVIRAEQQSRARRAARLAGEDPDHASDQWLCTDKPFVNELCLILLVAVWHQVERELIWLQARIMGGGREISREQYLQNMRKAEESWGRNDAKETIIGELKLRTFPAWESSMKTLRLLANCYKHDPSLVPGKKILKHLGLDESLNYMPLPASERFRVGLAAHIGLPKDADYCDIAEKLLNCAAGFLADLQEKSEQTGRLSTWGPVNFGDPAFYGH